MRAYLPLAAMGILVVLIMAVLIVGASYVPPEETNSQLPSVCVDGVEYIRLPVVTSSSWVPHMNVDGTVYTCE